MRSHCSVAHSVQRLLLVLGVAIAGLFLMSTTLNAQTLGSINGVVTDSNGATVQGAVVTATNSDTGVVGRAITSSAGTYTIPALNPGKYVVTVEANGFKKGVRAGVNVDIAQQTAANFTLAPGATSQTVQVTSSAVSLNTEQPEIGTTLPPELVKSAPIEISGIARQIDQFVFLVPGVQGNSFAKNINGGVNFESEVVFNGIPVPQPETQGYQTNFNPPFEMVNEFNVDRATFSAQYGLAQGAVTYNMASGTNQLHGDAFEILRNQLFDSVGFFPTYFRPDGHPAPPPDQQNDYGFTVSGPVILPHIYNGKNRTFFLFSTDWFKQNIAQTSIGTVPTPAMKTGDFSHFLDANGNQIPIYDPQTGQPFPGNIIPVTRFSTLAKSIIPFIPDPDRTGVNFGQIANKSPAVTALPINQHLWGYTLDHNISQSQSIHFTQWRDARTTSGFDYAPIVPSTNELQSLKTLPYLGSGFLLNYVKTVTPNLVATAGADWIGEINNQFDAKLGVNFPGVINSTIFPNVTFDGQNAITDWGTAGGWIQSINRKLGIALVNNWLWTHGRHTINFGGEYRRSYQDDNECQQCGGTFNFSQRTTSTPNANDPNFGSYGSSFASFLLGEVDSGVRVFATELKLRNRDFSPYFQDDIKVNPRLTINAGLRWDIMVPFTENHDQIVYLNPTEPDPGAGNLPGAATKFGNCAGCSGINRAAIHWGHFGPRIGLSYMLNSKTVIQSGFYLAFLDGGAYEYGTNKVAVNYANLLEGEFHRNSTNTSAPGYGNWDTNPMPDPPPQPFSPSIGNGNIIHELNPAKDGRAPYNQTWNINVQRQLPYDMVLSVAYIGNRDIHLPSQLNPPNQLNPSYLKYGALLGDLINSPQAIAAGFTPPYSAFISQFGSAATVSQALLPYPQYSGVMNNFETSGTSFYNGLQAQVEKRFTNGLSYLSSVTLSRNLANVDSGFTSFASAPVNKYNQKPEYTVSGLDQKYLVRVVGTYELPVGYGQKYLNNRGWLAQIAGGWQISAILDYEGGTPFGAYDNYNPVGNGFDRPNIVPGVHLKTFNYHRSIDYFTGKLATQPVQFTTNAFALTQPFALGDSSRNYASLRNPPLRVENFDAAKFFHITRQLTGELRVDYFNAFNRTQLQGPDNNASDSTFGQITNTSSQISNRQGQATFRLEF
jgi:hypothetical protein